MSTFHIERSATALLARYGANCAAETSPALEPTPPVGIPLPSGERAGEVLLTPGQKVALLKIRRSDWAKAVLKHLIAFGKADCTIDDYRVLERLHMAVNKGSFHVLTPHGRWTADIEAMKIARAEGMHVVTYDFGRGERHELGGAPATAHCTCGWRVSKSRMQSSYASAIGRAGVGHLRHVGAMS